ncbi:GNAT family N-acetyltransferase [candidate division KSB1 bacterium]|nr:GNAT family N-acetyltransferase [candidate division KSB1 bacterium]
MSETNIWAGKLVRLRPVEPEDWVFFAEIETDSELSRLVEKIDFPFSIEAIKKWVLDTSLKKPHNDEYRWMIENADKEVVGTIMTHTCEPRMGTFQYGVSILRKFWSRGYAGDAIKIVLNFFFHELRYHKVNAQVYTFNEGSIKLHQKLGFQEEGRMRRMIYTNGSYHDELIFGMTKEEFENLAQK